MHAYAPCVILRLGTDFPRRGEAALCYIRMKTFKQLGGILAPITSQLASSQRAISQIFTISAGFRKCIKELYGTSLKVGPQPNIPDGALLNETIRINNSILVCCVCSKAEKIATPEILVARVKI